MSGIAGLLNLNGQPVHRDQLSTMTSFLTTRGPDAQQAWMDGVIGLSHTLLRTTEEAAREQQPISLDGQVWITADARIDGRSELKDKLAAKGGPTDLKRATDVELILHTYHVWGNDCVDHLLGDFAFAVWDAPRKTLFCARDQFGVRPFYYHYARGRFFAFASEPRAILVLPQVPYRINEGRIADFLVDPLEGIDKTSTFFEEVYRFPPAHAMTISSAGMRQRRYWTLEPGPELRLASNADYAEAFLDVFTQAVRCRLRGTGSVGSMLSGGMDSGSIVAVARELLAKADQEPLPTFSGVAPDPETCVETQSVNAALTMGDLDPHVINPYNWDEILPQLVDLTWNQGEPFDSHMTLLRTIYLTSHRCGIKAILDGVDGDTVLSEGSYIAHLLHRGSWLTAYREAVGQNRFWGGAYPAWRELYKSARSAFTPNAARRLYHRMVNPRRERRRLEQQIRESLIRPSFARQISLAERLKTMDGYQPGGLTPHLSLERARAIEGTFLTVGIERYNRVASAVAVEPRHPFLDRRVVAFCLSLPPDQLLARGWPKAILRRAMAGRVPDSVRWRQGKQHLGWIFTASLMEKLKKTMAIDIKKNIDKLKLYIDTDGLQKVYSSYFDIGDMQQADQVYETVQLAVWLHRHEYRPWADPDTCNLQFRSSALEKERS